MTITFKPTLNRLLVKEIPSETKLESGLLAPNQAVKFGKVLAVGPGGRNNDGVNIDMKVKKGDTVVYKSWITELRDGIQWNYILNEQDILGTI